MPPLWQKSQGRSGSHMCWIWQSMLHSMPVLQTQVGPSAIPSLLWKLLHATSEALCFRLLCGALCSLNLVFPPRNICY